MASCVDDLTLQHDLIRSAPPALGWYRIASDDLRLLRLIQEVADPEAGQAEVLAPLARLFGTVLVEGPGGMTRVDDRSGASVAVAAPLPGERERPCELVTAPLPLDRAADGLEARPGLDAYLREARRLGFTAPQEGATHLHFDATPFQSPCAFAALVLTLAERGEALKASLGPNPHCRRLGPWPQALLEVVREPGFAELSWTQACARVGSTGLSKYCDFNLLNVIGGHPMLNTVEIRVLPVHLEAAPILAAARRVVELFEQALQSTAPSQSP